MPPVNDSYIIENFEEAAENGYIKAYFQPIIRTLTGKVCCMETLARWNDPQKGLLPPYVFIETLEKHRLICKLDLIMLENICRHYNMIAGTGKAPIPYSFNLSRLDFDEPDISDRITGILEKYNVPSSAVHIEITESVLMNNTERFRTIFNDLHRCGFEIWMDDFGSGFASLNVLKDYEFDLLKIDMKFLSSMNDRSRKIISAVVSMAKSLGIHTLAEGVETKEQVDFLSNVGCELLQGYFYSKPLSAEQLADYFRPVNVLPETEEERKYLDTIGGLNVLSSDPFDDFCDKSKTDSENSRKHSDDQYPIALLEYKNERFSFAYANNGYISELKLLGFNGLDDAERQINDPSKPFFSGTMKQMNSSIELAKAVKKDYIINDIYYSLTLMFIARTESKIMMALNLRVFCSDGIEDRYHEINRYSRTSLYNFDLVNIIDPEKNTSKQIYSNLPFDTEYGYIPLKTGVIRFAQNELYVSDRDRYLRFMDFTTIDERITKNGCPFVQQPFRLRLSDEEYNWRMIRITHIPTPEEYCYIFSVQQMTPLEISITEKLTSENPDLLESSGI